MAGRSKLLLLSASLGLGLGVGCRDREPETFQVRVISIDAHGGPAIPEDRIRAIVRRSLQHSPSYTPAERDQRSGGSRGDTLFATFEYRELPDASDHGRDLMVWMSIEPPQDLVDRLGSEGLDVTVLLERAAGEADLSQDLQLASNQLVEILQARTDLARFTEGSVERLLATADPELIIPTLEWVRDHESNAQARAAADQVAELIEHEDVRVGLLAIETIGKIGGPEHVSTLLERIQLADTHQANRAYGAIADLGGPEAVGFLQFAARNEEEPGRRALAERALRRVAESDIVQPGSRAARLRNRGHR